MEERKYKGTPYLPADHIEGAIIKATAHGQFKMKGRKTYHDFAVACLYVVEPEIEFKNEAAHNWKIFEKAVRKPPKTGGRVLGWRPMWSEWEFDFTIRNMQPKQMDDKTLRDILEYAGLYIGIGDWRPKFGQFEVIKCEPNGEAKGKPYREYKCTIRGIRPLLHNRFPGEPNESQSKKVYDPMEEAIKCLYLKAD